MFKTSLLVTFATIAAISANCQAQWVDYESVSNEAKGYNGNYIYGNNGYNYEMAPVDGR